MIPPITYSKTEFRSMWARNIRVVDIASAFDASIGWVSGTARKLGLPSRKHRLPRNYCDQQFSFKWGAGVSITKMAAHYKKQPRWVHSRVLALGLPRR